jgi:hypothetical protein
MALSQVRHLVGVLVHFSRRQPTLMSLDEGKATEAQKWEPNLYPYSARRIPLLRLILQGSLIVALWVNVGR